MIDVQDCTLVFLDDLVLELRNGAVPRVDTDDPPRPRIAYQESVTVPRNAIGSSEDGTIAFPRQAAQHSSPVQVSVTFNNPNELDSRCPRGPPQVRDWLGSARNRAPQMECTSDAH